MFKKFKGANLMLKTRKSKQLVRSQDLIPKQSWVLKEGDHVQIICGKTDLVGKQGIISSCLYDRNKIVVEGINMRVQTVQRNIMYPKGGQIAKESPIHYSMVQLLDPQTKMPVKAYRRGENRFDAQSREIIPWPETDPHKDEEDGPFVTNRADVLEVGYTPSLLQHPFPTPLLNEMERMRRKNKERAIL